MRRLIRLVGIAAAIIAWGAIPAFAAQHAEMRERHPHMMQMHEEMREKMAQRAERLEELLDEMNRATGDDRIDAIAEVVNELASQHLEMHEMMRKKGDEGRHHPGRQQMMRPEGMRESPAEPRRRN